MTKPTAIFLLICFGLGALTGTFALHDRLGGSSDENPATASPVDIGFAQTMAAHHSQAITMAQLMLDGRPTRLTNLARKIAYNQLYELGEMQGWLKLWGKPLNPQPLQMDWMLLGQKPLDAELQQYLVDCDSSPTGMPGLAPTVELEKLRSLEGIKRDQHFLQLMLAHHQGGVPMARFAGGNAQLKVVQQLAKLIVLEQSKEIMTLQRTLTAIKFATSNHNQ